MIHVGVYQFAHFNAGRTTPASIVGLFVFTIDVGGKSPSQSDSCPADRPVKKLGVSYVVVLYGANERTLGVVVTEYIVEKQSK